MNSHEHHTSKLETCLILALPYIGTTVVAALAYWLYHLDISTRM